MSGGVEITRVRSIDNDDGSKGYFNYGQEKDEEEDVKKNVGEIIDDAKAREAEKEKEEEIVDFGKAAKCPQIMAAFAGKNKSGFHFLSGILNLPL